MNFDPTTGELINEPTSGSELPDSDVEVNAEPAEPEAKPVHRDVFDFWART